MKDTAPKIIIAIAAFNEGSVIKNVITEINSFGFFDIVVVDDGSKDDTFTKAGNISGVVTLRHKINRGKGAATKTAIEAAKLLGADIVVTMDGDGQHDPSDIEKLIAPIKNEKFDAILGSRLMNPKGMPFYKIIHNKIANLITWYLYGLWVTDSQSGFRAYSKKAIEKIDTKGDRYEYDSEVIREIYKHKLKHKELPIKVRYTEYSMGKIQKQGLLNGVKTLYKMIWNLVS
ncbi:MAG: glycosyltransferase family 2 protein [Parcubacteria group bacterium]|jgi:glycosyltransferase involved in cell wall biosynthesis